VAISSNINLRSLKTRRSVALPIQQQFAKFCQSGEHQAGWSVGSFLSSPVIGSEMSMFSVFTLEIRPAVIVNGPAYSSFGQEPPQNDEEYFHAAVRHHFQMHRPTGYVNDVGIQK
jgi:hypothetical protein